MTRPVRHLRAVETRSDLRGRINLALSLLSLLSHRPVCPQCQHTAELVQTALSGASIDELRVKDQ